MPQNATLGDAPTPPVRVPDESIDLSAGIVKKPAIAAANDSIDLSAGLVPRKGKAGQPPTKESEGVWNKLWKGTVSPETATKAVQLGITLPKPEEYAKQAETYRKQGRSGAAALSDLEGYTASFYKVTGDVVSSLTSPGQLGLMAATAGGSELEQAGYQTLARMARLPGRAAGLWFGAQGLKIAATPQQSGESQYDAFWRRTLGASAFFGTAYSEGATVKAGFTKGIRTMFDLNENLSSKVADQVSKIDEVRKQTSTKVNLLDADTIKTIKNLQDSLHQEIPELQTDAWSLTSAIRAKAELTIKEGQNQFTDMQVQRIREGANQVADTMQALYQEKIRVTKPFDEIEANIKEEVPRGDVKSIVEKAFESEGISPDKIPPRALDLLTPGRERVSSKVALRGPTGDYAEVNPEDVPSLLKRGYRSAREARDPNSMVFDQLTRLREDLGQVGDSATDTAIERGAFKARDEVTDFQEKVAERNGQGEAYRKAKNDYKNYVRGIGSKMVHTFLGAEDAQAEGLSSKMARLLTREHAEDLRDVLRSAGVDTKPLQRIIADIDAHEKQITEAQQVAKQHGERSIAEVKKQEEAEISKIKETPVKGKRTLEKFTGEEAEALRGLTDEQLKKMHVRHQMNNMAASGLGSGAVPFMLLYGLIRLAGGGNIEGGLAMTAYGASKIAVPKMLENPGVQDWVIRQAEIEPGSPQSIRMKRGITALRKMLKTGVPQAAAVKASQGLGETPQPPAR